MKLRRAKHQPTTRTAGKLSRRTVLRGMLGASTVVVGLPALELFLNDSGTAYADGTSFPKRFGVWFWGNGVWAPGVWSSGAQGNEAPIDWDWYPPTVGSGFELEGQLAALERHRSVLTVISGMELRTGSRFPHTSGACGMLSGASPVEQVAGSVRWPHPTLDQIIADEIGRDSTYRSLETAAIRDDFSVSYRGPDARNPSEHSPRRLFERVFGASFRAPGDVIDADRIGLRRSVLDVVKDQSARLQRQLGHADRVRMERHYEAVRDLEVRLGRLLADPPVLSACAPPSMPAEVPDDDRGRQQIGLVNELMADMLAMALACDQTRVFSHLFTKPVGNTRLPIDGLELFGVLEGHHTITHDEPRFEPG